MKNLKELYRKKVIFSQRIWNVYLFKFVWSWIMFFQLQLFHRVLWRWSVFLRIFDSRSSWTSHNHVARILRIEHMNLHFEFLIFVVNIHCYLFTVVITHWTEDKPSRFLYRLSQTTYLHPKIIHKISYLA